MSTFVTSETQCHQFENILDRKTEQKQIVRGGRRKMLNSLSRGAPSTTRPPLRCGVIMSMRFCLQGIFRFLPKFLSLYTLQVLAVKSRTIQVRVGTRDTNSAQWNHGTFTEMRND